MNYFPNPCTCCARPSGRGVSDKVRRTDGRGRGGGGSVDSVIIYLLFKTQWRHDGRVRAADVWPGEQRAAIELNTTRPSPRIRLIRYRRRIGFAHNTILLLRTCSRIRRFISYLYVARTSGGDFRRPFGLRRVYSSLVRAPLLFFTGGFFFKNLFDFYTPRAHACRVNRQTRERVLFLSILFVEGAGSRPISELYPERLELVEKKTVEFVLE